MARDLSTAEANEVQKAQLQPVLFVELAWPDGMFRAWSGLGSFTWGGNTFTGVGDFGGVSPIAESSDGRANGITLSLSGIDTALISTILTQNYQGRAGKIWLGFVNSSNALVEDPPYQIFAGKMDVCSIEESGESSMITVSIENQMIILQQSSGRRFTHEDQLIDYPEDLGLEYVPAINQDRPINWGQPGGSIVARQYGASRQTY